MVVINKLKVFWFRLCWVNTCEDHPHRRVINKGGHTCGECFPKKYPPMDLSDIKRMHEKLIGRLVVKDEAP